MSDLKVTVDGLEELQEAFANVCNRYPDSAGELLQTQAKVLRKDVIKMVKNDTDVTNSKQSLSKQKSYKISEVKGFGANQYVEVSGTAPHFHLLENGHQMVLPKTRTVTRKDGSKEKVALANGGTVKGWVPGYKFMDRASKNRSRELPSELEKMVSAVLREEGLI